MSAIHVLADQVVHDPMAIWAYIPGAESVSVSQGRQREEVARALLDVWHQNNEDGRQTKNYFGLCAVSNEVLYQVEEVNRLKTAFEVAVNDFLDDYKGCSGNTKQRLPARNELLVSLGLARLHLRQAYRKITALDSKPEKIGFSWCQKGRSIRRITVEEASQMLVKKGFYQMPHIELQLKKLANLPVNAKLAQVQEQAPQLRVNPVWRSYHANEVITERKTFNTSLPIFMPHEGKLNLPTFNPNIFLIERRPSTRLRRSDARIEIEPFLPSVRVHRYIR